APTRQDADSRFSTGVEPFAPRPAILCRRILGAPVSRRPGVSDLPQGPARRDGPRRAADLGGVPYGRAAPARAGAWPLRHRVGVVSGRTQRLLRLLYPGLEPGWRAVRRRRPPAALLACCR